MQCKGFFLFNFSTTNWCSVEDGTAAPPGGDCPRGPASGLGVSARLLDSGAPPRAPQRRCVSSTQLAHFAISYLIYIQSLIMGHLSVRVCAALMKFTTANLCLFT